MADKDQSNNIFQNLLDVVIKRDKGLSRDGVQMGSSATFNPGVAGSREEMQQNFLEWQRQIVANDLYERSMNFGTDRISAYQDYRAMDNSPEVSKALSIMKDECLTQNEYGQVLQIYSDQERVKKALEDLFMNRLNINEALSLWIREMLKWGDYFVYLHIDKDNGVMGYMNYHPSEVHREEGYGDDLGSVRFRLEGSRNMILEEWQMSHFRLIDDSERLPYGRSILDPARKTWKQLQLAEDSMLVYRLCLAGDTRIKTDEGYKYIRDIREGDNVVTFNTDMSVEYTKVLHQVNNGKKKMLRVRSKTHELLCTETHPILVHEKGIFHYVDAKDLIVKRHQLINPDLSILPITRKKIETELFNQYTIISDEGKGLLKGEGKGAIKYSSDWLWKPQLKRKRVGIPLETAIAVCEEHGIDRGELTVYNKRFRKGSSELNLPEYVDEDFARLFGFMIGNGYVRKFGIGFAEGMDKEVNEHYAGLIKKFFGKIVHEKEKREGRFHGKYFLNSTLAAMIFKNLGFISGAHNKRIPQWVFQAEPEVRKAMVLGFSDADGCERFTKSKQKRWFSTIEICNKQLLEDIKELWGSLGMSSGQIATRNKKKRYVESMGRTMKATTAYSMTISELPVSKYENVLSVEDAGEGEVYDITVEHDNHNFLANNTVTHNTRAPDRKVFYVEVGNLEPNEIQAFIQQIQKSVKKAPTIDIRNGQRDFKYNPQNVTEDYFMPIRGDHHSKIDTLPGASNMNDIMDIQYLENKLLCSLGVPKAYLNYTEGIQGGSTLSQADIRFARTINRFQEMALMELRKIAKVHLYILGFKEDYENFSLKLNNPSTQMELMKLEIMKARLEVGKEWFSPDAFSFSSWTWVMENIMGFSKNDIKKMLKQKKVEKKLFAEIDAAAETYKKIGIFKDIDSKFEIAGAPPEGGTGGGESSGGGEGGFGGTSALGGMDDGFGGDMGDDMSDMGGGDMGGGAPAPAPAQASGGEASAADMALGESDKRINGMINELLEDDEKREEMFLVEKSKNSMVDSGEKIMKTTSSLFDRLESKFGVPQMMDKKRKEVIKEAIFVESNDNPLLNSYNEQTSRINELHEMLEEGFMIEDVIEDVNDEEDKEHQ